jgi:hypothetical protein
MTPNGSICICHIFVTGGRSDMEKENGVLDTIFHYDHELNNWHELSALRLPSATANLTAYLHILHDGVQDSISWPSCSRAIDTTYLLTNHWRHWRSDISPLTPNDSLAIDLL